ncbi:MAG: lysophospholipase [marine benthic group bacterium]|jgi:putative redox protein|nr:lysophospholipase [Gemmatimonadota bacterium]MCL7938212.1 lysophospholipase [Gemmatimonadota bacterium]MCL7965783.1 lysophospholipase [Gemmatimonadota bacterium]MCL7969988.1 lysophospholipase [Gemmatimonadota bacterium]MCL7974024.1 lysophospholipase [Gemmatimonadota bacterium]
MGQSKKIRFPGSTGDLLTARLDIPESRPAAWALFAHCFTCSKDLKAVVNLSRALNEAKVAVMRFDFTGLGESEGDFADTSFASNVDDLIAAAEYLAAEHEPVKILVGHSLGGAAVLQAAADVPSAVAVATIGAPADPAHVTHLLTGAIDDIRRDGQAEVMLAGRRFTIGEKFLDDLEETRQQERIRSLDRALIIFHSPVDRVVGIDNAAKIYASARHPKSFISLDEADHLLTDPSDASYVGEVLAAWSRKYIPECRSAPE